VHFAKIAEDLLRILPSRRPLLLLDWGAGEALAAPAFAKAGIRVLLYDPVPLQSERTRARFDGHAAITVVDDRTLKEIAGGSLDVIVVNSVLQYVSREEFEALLPFWHRLLVESGLLFLGDIVPKDASLFQDVSALLSAGLKNGYLIEALFGLGRTFFSNYRRVRHEHGFTVYEESDIIALLAKAGFSAERTRPNIGLAPHRMLIRARKKETL
jgi:SAM-dependent methyltransferase